jgi:aspartate aminotransferase
MNYKISDRAASLSPSLTLAIDSKAKQMKAEGLDVVGFGAGEPDFDTPQHIKDAAVKALAEGFTKYTPASGILELRQAIAEKFKRENGLSYKASQIIVSCGGKHSCYNVILATCQAGDEVIIPAPYWLSYPEMVKLAGATPVIVPTTDKTEFKLTPEVLRQALTPRTRLFILNSPSNPTGSVYSPAEIQALGDVCIEKGVLIMSDEIYEHLLYDGAVHQSVASFSARHFEHTIVVHGFAKAWSMTGWRLGFCAAPEPIAKAIDAIQSHSTSNPTSFAQKGAVAALNGPQNHLQSWLSEFNKRRSFAWDKLNRIPGISCVNAKGAFYLFPNISQTGLKSTEFCARLLESEKVAAVPGIAFGADDYIRISYATSMANLQKGLERMERFAKSLRVASQRPAMSEA